MSAAFKFATLASGFTLFSASALYTFRNSKQEFSSNALALEHTYEPQTRGIPKPKVYMIVHRRRQLVLANVSLHRPSNFVPISVGGYEIRATA